MVKKSIKYTLLLFCVFLLRTNAQTIEVDANTDTTEYLIGDYIRFNIEVAYDNNISIMPPSIQDAMDELVLVEVSDPAKEENDSRIIENFSYILSMYDSSDVTIPSISIFYTITGDTSRHIINTNEVEITVHSIDVNISGEIQDVKKPLYIEYDWLFFIIISVIIIAVLLVAYYFYRKYKKKKESIIPEKRIILVPPHKTAIKALFELEKKKLWQQGEIKKYHSEVTGIIRKYFENRFGFLALEMTSSEILTNLKSKKITNSIFDLTNNFLSNADLVKFAKYLPLPSVNEVMMKQAFEIVNKTKPEEKVEIDKKVVYAE